MKVLAAIALDEFLDEADDVFVELFNRSGGKDEGARARILSQRWLEVFAEPLEDLGACRKLSGPASESHLPNVVKSAEESRRINGPICHAGLGS